MSVVANSDRAETRAIAGVTQLADLLALPAPLDDEKIGGDGVVYLEGLRDRALDFLHEQSLPTTKDEDWRFTDLSPLVSRKFDPLETEPDGATLESAHCFLGDRTLDDAYTLIFVDGHFASHLSHVPPTATVTLTNLRGQVDQVRPYLGQLPDGDEVFTALNTARFQDAAILQVLGNQAISRPIHIVHLFTPGPAKVIQPRLLVLGAANSTVTLVEEYLSQGRDEHFINGVTEIYLGTNAHINHVRMQNLGDRSVIVGKTVISQARDSHYQGNSISVGGLVGRHNWHVFCQGEQTDTQLHGLVVATGEQLADTHSGIYFSAPHGRSQQVHKCIVGDRARAVFNGKIDVPKAAQLTDAAQMSRTLLLSPKARVDTKPQLEIVADNVKCAHGATVSQLNPEDIFYLQSRGLDPQQAQDLLVKAFAIEQLDKIPMPNLRLRLEQLILDKIHFP
ncbi:Fe-S cluster assembly protein SufD [Candidatus Synechococcus calcipolaris G9]|uniref:Fe-S cluster assembly protein SufD n=1 Tax=Candidatus Synechococcus calcipolaris G9 TaxID=1497997 RepID=A0ABT6EZL0_9SYNE|nr:Fe-S cluster assembly protein SufD [Candidatus Synechococcus calcipolaris]MDG2991013.1 Fe-S cluster assembly protein SufD [Candidatus Synechococcus calcipolaris G9]